MKAKNFLLQIFILLGMLVFTSCKPEVVKSENISVSPDSDIEFAAFGNKNVVLKVISYAEWNCKYPDWIRVSKEKDRIIVNVEDNNTPKNRVGRIVFSAGTAPLCI